jgi:hypothetical protein
MDDSETGEYCSNVEVLPVSKKSLVVILLATLGDQQHITDVSEDDISSVFRI